MSASIDVPVLKPHLKAALLEAVEAYLWASGRRPDDEAVSAEAESLIAHVRGKA